MSECPDRYAIKYDKDLGYDVIMDSVVETKYNGRNDIDLKILCNELNRLQNLVYTQRELLMRTSIKIDEMNDNLALYHELAHRCDLDGMDKQCE